MVYSSDPDALVVDNAGNPVDVVVTVGVVVTGNPVEDLQPVACSKSEKMFCRASKFDTEYTLSGLEAMN